MYFANNDWRNRAACRDADPELFFPIAGENTATGAAQYREARAVCVSCPVRAACLDYSIDAGLDDGMYGGMTPGERRELVKDQPVTATA
jgi:WhiB family redox-sensing transcriptional regulator